MQKIEIVYNDIDFVLYVIDCVLYVSFSEIVNISEEKNGIQTDKDKAAVVKRLKYNLDKGLNYKIAGRLYYPISELKKYPDLKKFVLCELESICLQLLINDNSELSQTVTDDGKTVERLRIEAKDFDKTKNDFTQDNKALREKNEYQYARIESLKQIIEGKKTDLLDIKTVNDKLQKQFIEVEKVVKEITAEKLKLENEASVIVYENKQLHNDILNKDLRLKNRSAVIIELEEAEKLRRKYSLKGVLKNVGEIMVSRELVYITFLFVLIVQVFHNANLFYSVEVAPSWILAFFFAVGVDLFALIITIHLKHENILKGFAVFQFLLNILYYKVWLNFSEVSPDFVWSLVSTTLIAGLLAAVIYWYGELFTTLNKKN